MQIKGNTMILKFSKANEQKENVKNYFAGKLYSK